MAVSNRDARVAAITSALVLSILAPPWLNAQTPAPATGAPVFEVASVTLNRSGDLRAVIQPQPGGRFTATNASLRMLIRDAYQIQDFQLAGTPSWLNALRFDIAANAKNDAPPDQMWLMLQTLLAERFKLKVHHETRELPSYALVMMRSDGQIGPQLRRAAGDCARAPLPSGPTSPDGPPPCGFFGPAPGTDFSSGRGNVAFRGLTMEAFAKLLATALRRTVVDRTGLRGYFDGEYEFTVETGPPPPPPGVADPFNRRSLPSILTVLPERLGLKLESQRSALEVLVIDSVQPRPD